MLNCLEELILCYDIYLLRLHTRLSALIAELFIPYNSKNPFIDPCERLEFLATKRSPVMLLICVSPCLLQHPLRFPATRPGNPERVALSGMKQKSVGWRRRFTELHLVN